ncbi:YhcN/YlaJ family sporulation lipoprotein [Virgibacillus halotolerans]|uniref:YhcN/YlaJ family sporulation lipoprotein n=1 Tax=Virgibacillus halotolerans TaxID=1071053 RepID=UPI001960177B|nr:YhcN/YlaJ family sporulation lipoprotein [Virgibacillus halotolerans]MBM7600209.1 YhcN/YlaJ family sporulation lipoprotein [Virgibacillus halotolerans]
MKWKLFSILTVLILALVACGTTDRNEEGRTDRNNNNVENTRYNNTGDGMTNDRDHTLIRNSERDQDGNRNNVNNVNNRDTSYDVAEEAADRITEEVDDIDHAYVLTTKNNAYVAADLDADHRDRDKNKDRDRNTNNDNNNMNNNFDDNDGNREGDKLTDEVKEQIGDIVKSVDNNIDNVYVSTDPDFLNLTNNYVDKMNNGQPIEGFFDEFGNMVERLFPQNRR